MIYDVIGVGFGPSNIALAIAMQESRYPGKALFVERNARALWHEGMLLDHADIQNSPLRDLITPVNPRSYYTFINFLHQSGRFFHYLNVGLKYPLRKEFFRYVSWAASHFSNVSYNTNIARVEFDHHNGDKVWRLTSSTGAQLLAKKLVLATGRKLNIPSVSGLEGSPTVVHLTKYLQAIDALDRSASVAVLGGSQSAVEILLDLMNKGFQKIYSIHRSFSFRLKDTSPFSDEVYFPEFVDYYHGLPTAHRARLDEQVRQTNYSSADSDVIDALYRMIYEELLDGIHRLRIFRNYELTQVLNNGHLELTIGHLFNGATESLNVDLLVLATGFLDLGRDGRAALPSLLKDISHMFSWDGDYLKVKRDYSVSYTDECGPLPDLYLNGLCESSHGLGDAGSFSLVSIRARDILESLGREIV